jgi:ferric-dicitrate binding protein FerR (iron transport regulator)
MGKKHKIRVLLDRYRKGVATDDEKYAVASWLEHLDALDKPLSDERVERYAERSRAQLRQRLLLQPSEGKVRRLGHWVPWMAAASVVVGAFTIFFFKYPDRTRSPAPIVSSIITSTDRSLLQLADGTAIYLDTLADSTILLDGGMSVHIRGNEVHYGGGFSEEPVQSLRHTLIASKGKRFRLVLPDSTRIWLNSDSRLTYPLRFERTARLTEVSGEAYFEVSKAANWPFVVKAAGDELAIRVLGTAFNVSAYEKNKTVQTTLVSGSVGLEIPGRPGGNTILKPSQKAIYSIHDKALLVKTVDTDRETDWVHNRLVFRQTPMSEVLTRLSRFYNVGFNVKNKNIYQYTFTGTFDNKPLETVLEYMQISSRIRYTILHKAEKTIVELK